MQHYLNFARLCVRGEPVEPHLTPNDKLRANEKIECNII
jgi:hypothetical protein